MKIALDRDVLRAFLSPGGGGQVWESTEKLLLSGMSLYVLPTIAAEVEKNGDEAERRWRDATLTEITADEFLMGCAATMARRYMDYHPDPRDCRIVAEAECAKMDALVTMNDDLISGLAGRVENVRIEKPWEALARLKKPPAS